MNTVRWPSTWSGPDCASSSITKMQVSFHCGLCETASTTRPSARSLSAIIARGVGYCGLVPSVWSQGRLMIIRSGTVSLRLNSSYSPDEDVGAELVALEQGPVVDLAVDAAA